MVVPDELTTRTTRVFPGAAVQIQVIHAIGSLGPGGAERQLAALACGLQARAREHHSVLTIAPLDGPSAHFHPMLNAAGVEVAMAGCAPDAAIAALLRRDRTTRSTLALMPSVLRPWSIDLAGEFLARRPDVVHAWLDHTNVCAGIAALATGVPRIVLSLRSVNPSHFPMLHLSWMLGGYRALAACSHVQFVANSRAGAEDYARWIGMDPARIAVIHNGLDPSHMVTGSIESIEASRRELVPNGERLVLGVLRLSEEKQPLLFVEAARIVLASTSNCRVVLVGDGPLFDEVARAARPLGERFLMLGRRNDVAQLMSCAHVLALCSRMEGTPNVLIEAQSLGVPVVSTAVGGAVDAVDDGYSGILCPPNQCELKDARALASALARVLSDDALRERMSLRARAFVRERFSLEAMLNRSQQLYR